MLSSRIAILLVVLCAFSPRILAIQLLKCPQGKGLVDPDMNPYGEAKPGECKQCVVSNCNTCYNYYKKCEECKAGYGFNSKKTKCVPCSDANCGVCLNNYTKCEAKIATCTTKIDKVSTAAVRNTWNKDGPMNYCRNKPGFIGTGRFSVFTGAVTNGSCLDCNGPEFRPLTDGDMEYCSFYYRARSVAANAFKPKEGCPYPGSIQFKLKRTCVSQMGDLPFDINFVIGAKYCGQTKTIAVNGGGVYNPSPKIDPASEWKYAVRP